MSNDTPDATCNPVNPGRSDSDQAAHTQSLKRATTRGGLRNFVSVVTALIFILLFTFTSTKFAICGGHVQVYLTRPIWFAIFPIISITFAVKARKIIQPPLHQLIATMFSPRQFADCAKHIKRAHGALVTSTTMIVFGSVAEAAFIAYSFYSRFHLC